MIAQIRKYRQELFMLLSFPLAIFFNQLYINIILWFTDDIKKPFLMLGRAFCVKEGFYGFPFPSLFMIWEIIVPLTLVYLLRNKINPTFIISFFYIPELNYLILKGIDFFYTTRIDTRYMSWFGYNCMLNKSWHINYHLFLIHFVVLYLAQYLLFRKYEQSNLVKNLALGMMSYASSVLIFQTYYYVLRTFITF